MKKVAINISDNICKFSKRYSDRNTNAKYILNKIWNDVSEEANKVIEEYYSLINDRLNKSILIGGNAVFIDHHTNHIINKAYDLNDFFRLRNENPLETIIIFNRPNGTYIPNDEQIGEKEA